MKSRALVLFTIAVLISSTNFRNGYAQRDNVYSTNTVYYLPPRGHFNTFVSNAITLGYFNYMIQEPLGWYIWYNKTYMPWLATEWSFQGNDLVVQLRQGVEWHNGMLFTSSDVVSTFYILYMLSAPAWNYLTNVTATSDYTVTFSFKEPSYIGLFYILSEPIRPYSTYGNFSDAVIDSIRTVSPMSLSNLTASFNNYRPTEYIGTGPFTWTGEMTEAELWLQKSFRYWHVQDIKFDWIHIYAGDSPVAIPLLLAKKIDNSYSSIPLAVYKQFEEMPEIKVILEDFLFRLDVYVNHARKPFDMVEFRRALIYAINRTQNAVLVNPLATKPDFVHTGLYPAQNDVWLDPSTDERLIHYDYNVSKAEEILNNAGFTKGSDGIWVAPDGTKCSFELAFPTGWGNFVTAAEDVAAQLRAFGIDFQLRSVDDVILYDRFISGDFDAIVWYWQAAHPHPYFMWLDLLTYNKVAAGPGIGFDMVRETSSLGTVNLTDLLMKSTEGTDEGAQREAINEIALVYNEQLPSITIWYWLAIIPVLEGVNVEGWPSTENWIWRQLPGPYNPIVTMIVTGYGIQPVGWAPPIPVGVLEKRVSDLESEVANLTQAMESLRGSTESSAASMASSLSLAQGLSVISIVISLIAIVMVLRKPKGSS